MWQASLTVRPGVPIMAVDPLAEPAFEEWTRDCAEVASGVKHPPVV